MVEPVIIGNATLSRLALNNHVAALAKADQVRQFIGICRRVEVSKRFDVVDRYARTNVDCAPLACAAVPFNRFSSSDQPTLPAIGGYPANVIWSVGARLLFGFEKRVAGLAAKTKAGLRFVLASEPWLQFKASSALRTIVPLALNEVNCFGQFGREGIGRSETGAPTVSNLVAVRHWSNRHMPLAAALLAAKARLVGAVWLHFEGLAANLTRLFDHVLFVARTTGIAKRIEDAQRQPDLFIGAAA